MPSLNLCFIVALLSIGSSCTPQANPIEQDNGSVCPVGSQGCPCREDNSCDDDFICHSKQCVDNMDSEQTESASHENESDDSEQESSEQIDFGPVDLLFIMDNSLTMANHAARIGYDLKVLVDRLVEAGVDLRMGVTTTDLVHLRCSFTSPENGELQFSSCRSRLEDFVHSEIGTDTQAVGCTNHCSLTDITTTPTTTHVDPQAHSRPWLELSPTTNNLPPDQTLTDILTCTIPQGINGCGFEAPLEAMYKAIHLSEDPASPNYGFLRPEAQLVVLIVTDEVDCSAADMHIFDGNTTFWPDPEIGPSSSICWLAGTRCSGNGSPYDECMAENYGPDGMAGVADDQAVLHPLSRYLEVLQSANGMLFALNGVPPGFGFGEAEIEYFEPEDPKEKNFWGIAPGCTHPENPEEWALPPVRIKTLAAELQNERQNEPNLFSICRSSHRETMEEIASRILER